MSETGKRIIKGACQALQYFEVDKSKGRAHKIKTAKLTLKLLKKH